MRELSEQETKTVSGGSAVLTSVVGPLSPPLVRFDEIHYGRVNPVAVVPQFNLADIDFFSNQPDS
ncbi:MAG: hypothetical protein AB8B95_10565 [Pseudohongiellaceae bacterium]